MKHLIVCLLLAGVVGHGATHAQQQQKHEEQQSEVIELASRFYRELCTEMPKTIKRHPEIETIRFSVAAPTLVEESPFFWASKHGNSRPVNLSEFHAKPRNKFSFNKIGDLIIPLPTCQLVFEMKSFAPDEETRTAWQFLKGLSDRGGRRLLTPEYHLLEGVDLAKTPELSSLSTSDGHLCVSFSREKGGQWKVASVGYLATDLRLLNVIIQPEYPEYTPLQSRLIEKIRQLEETVFLAIGTAAIKATKQPTKSPPLRFPPRQNLKP